eukprot:3940590-Rhodomonas_salina.5
MTPEFRMGVYKIPVIDDPDQQKDSICFQLQMQLSDKRAVETKDLTKSDPPPICCILPDAQD